MNKHPRHNQSKALDPATPKHKLTATQSVRREDADKPASGEQQLALLTALTTVLNGAVLMLRGLRRCSNSDKVLLFNTGQVKL